LQLEEKRASGVGGVATSQQTVRAALRWRKGGQNRFQNPGVIQNAVTDVIGTSSFKLLWPSVFLDL
jgi:hypothetical protein